MNDKTITCRITRSDRPCLICSGYMDLIEARPPKFNLFGAVPFACASEGVDCLDCPSCGFKTTTDDYQYVSMCKTDSHENKSRKHRRQNSLGRSSSLSNERGSNGKNCSSCQTPFESRSWKYCPKCGIKCSEPAPEQRLSKSRANIIPDEIPKDIIIMENSSICDDSEVIGEHEDSRSIQNGIIRTVTPPTLTDMVAEYPGPVEMQY